MSKLKKKTESAFGTYPLIITTLDKFASEMLFDGKIGVVMCLESSSEVVEEIISYKSTSTSPMPLLDSKGNKIITDCKHSDVKVGQIYKDKCTLISVMTRFAIEHSFNYYAKISDKKSYVLQCCSEDCVWVFKASCRRGTELFKVRFFQDVQSCPLKDRVFTQLQDIIGFVNDFTAPKLVNYKRIHTPNDIIEDIKNIFSVDINYQKVWRAKERAIEILRGKPADSYRQMARYALVVVDGVHLSGAYKGTFFSAIILDGAGPILPIAYGVVDSENDNSWTWFFENFRIAFGEHDSMCVVSDRHESIIKAVSASSTYVYSVYDDGRKYIVCLDRRTCTCGRFQLDEITCEHAIAVLKSKHVVDMKLYCSEF
ncbi:uncharacterized protein LOC107858030 [Capsicum annuum]|uniref:uncharacterized protein LOC107858030 n=1 Tax=Capsicum annuum TaxID=4072 RepID=UPI0007BF7C10|nr:uncharacterized protein LOC107858030 [Capsicum annuum]